MKKSSVKYDLKSISDSSCILLIGDLFQSGIVLGRNEN